MCVPPAPSSADRTRAPAGGPARCDTVATAPRRRAQAAAPQGAAGRHGRAVALCRARGRPLQRRRLPAAAARGVPRRGRCGRGARGGARSGRLPDGAEPWGAPELRSIAAHLRHRPACARPAAPGRRPGAGRRAAGRPGDAVAAAGRGGARRERVAAGGRRPGPSVRGVAARPQRPVPVCACRAYAALVHVIAPQRGARA